MELPDKRRSSTALLVALLVVCSSAASVTALAGATATTPDAGASTASVDATTPSHNNTTEPADEVFVHENGDAVLVYEQDDDGEASTATGHLGLNVTEGLMHVLVRDELEQPSNVTGDAQFVLEPSALAGNGSFAAPRPENLENLDADVTAKRTETDASARASVDMTYVDDSEYSTTSTIESASTSGEASIAADEFSTSGSASAEYTESTETLQHREYTLEEGTDQYRLQASEEYYVSSYFASQWDTEENATRTIEQQYASIATALGGSADVTVSSYEFTEADDGRMLLDIEYQIVYSNVDDALGQQVAQQITNAEDVDVSTETAEAVGDAVAELQVDRVHAAVDAEGTSMQAAWDVQLSEYEPLVDASLDLAAEASEDENVTEQVERARQSYEAMKASGLVQTMSWEGSLSSPSENAVRVQASMQYDTQNYEAYVNELEARDLPTGGSVSFSASAQTDGEEVVAEMEYSVEREDLVDETLGNLVESAQNAQGAATGQAGTENVRRFVEAFQRSDFEKAKMNVDLREDDVQFQAGASFEDMESFRAVMQDEFDGEVASTYADLEGDSKAYVHVDGAFGENATESEVREHRAVDEDTTLHLPGDWDPATKEFPKMDQEEARNYLDIEEPETTTSAGTSDGGNVASGLPGFGVPAAFAAVAAASALLLGRLRRREN